MPPSSYMHPPEGSVPRPNKPGLGHSSKYATPDFQSQSERKRNSKECRSTSCIPKKMVKRKRNDEEGSSSSGPPPKRVKRTAQNDGRSRDQVLGDVNLVAVILNHCEQAVVETCGRVSRLFRRAAWLAARDNVNRLLRFLISHMTENETVEQLIDRVQGEDLWYGVMHTGFELLGYRRMLGNPAIGQFIAMTRAQLEALILQ